MNELLFTDDVWRNIAMDAGNSSNKGEKLW